MHLQSAKDAANRDDPSLEPPSTLVCETSSSAELTTDAPVSSTVVRLAPSGDSELMMPKRAETKERDAAPMYGANVQLSKYQVDSLMSVVGNHAVPESEWIRACHKLGDHEYNPKKRAFSYALPIGALLFLAFVTSVPWYAHFHQSSPMEIVVPPPPLAATSPDLSNYLDAMKNDIKAHWSQPVVTNGNPVVLVYQLDSSGAVKNLRVLNSSGLSNTDASALTAVQEAAPFQPLPAGAGDFIEVQLSLDNSHGGLAIGPPVIGN